MTSHLADMTLALLQGGNQRFVIGTLAHGHQGPARRAEIAEGQHPTAAVLTCSDSRVPPELVFDQGLGDLFVVRVAGNVAHDEAIASLEYAVAHLNVPLIIVLGHSRCGALTAVLKDEARHGHLPALAAAIRPAIQIVRGAVTSVAKGQVSKDTVAAAASRVAGAAGDVLDLVGRAHAQRTAKLLGEAEPVLREAVAEGKLRIVAAYYDVATGVVTFLS